MPLTIYTAQIIGIAVAVELVPHEEWLGWQSVPLFFVFAIPSLVLACAWKLVFTQGPLEWVFSRLTTHRPWPRRRKSPSGDPAEA
jgi:uncharacterized membrane protein YeiB